MAALTESKEASTSSGEGEQDLWKVLSAKITAKSDEMTAVNERRQAQRKIYQDLQSQKRAARESVPELAKRRNDIFTELKALSTEIRATHQEYHECVARSLSMMCARVAAPLALCVCACVACMAAA